MPSNENGFFQCLWKANMTEYDIKNGNNKMFFYTKKYVQFFYFYQYLEYINSINLDVNFVNYSVDLFSIFSDLFQVIN